MAGIGAITHAAEGGAQATEHSADDEHAFAKLGYQDEAPIVSFDPADESQKNSKIDEIENNARRLQNGIAGYAGDRKGDAMQLPPPVPHHPLSPKRVPEKRERKEWAAQNDAWAARADNAHGVAGNIALSRVPEGTYAYKLGNQPVGMMKLADKEDHTELTWLTTHPGVSGAGQSLVEKAANVSEANGHGGAVRLTSRDEAATRFYGSVGFRGDRSDMRLDPARSGLWNNNNGSWSLNANDGKGYLARKDEAAEEPSASSEATAPPEA